MLILEDNKQLKRVSEFDFLRFTIEDDNLCLDIDTGEGKSTEYLQEKYHDLLEFGVGNIICDWSRSLETALLHIKKLHRVNHRYFSVLAKTAKLVINLRKKGIVYRFNDILPGKTYKIDKLVINCGLSEFIQLINEETGNVEILINPRELLVKPWKLH